MILAVDVDYRADKAVIAGVTFDGWEQDKPKNVYRTKVTRFEEYQPGAFYKRELPCIIKLLKEHRLNPDYIVIDGFVTLGSVEKPGLGMHLYRQLGEKIPVVGVAKTFYQGVGQESEVFRGQSKKPLYITSSGVSLPQAKECIQSMYGEHRIPSLLKLVDRECRKS